MWFKLLVLVSVAVASSAKLTPQKFFSPPELDEIQDSVVEISAFRDPFDGLSYRLPNNTIPLHYNVWLTTDIHNGDFDFSGRVQIQIKAVENSTGITLHYRQLTIVAVDFLNAAGVVVQANAPFVKREDVEFLIISTPPLIEGTIYWVAVSYLGILRNDDAGFYRSSYQNPAGQTVWLATTQFESTDARHAFPW